MCVVFVLVDFFVVVVVLGVCFVDDFCLYVEIDDFVLM